MPFSSIKLEMQYTPSDVYTFSSVFLLLCQSLKLLTKSSYLLLKIILLSLKCMHIHTPALISGTDAVVWRWIFGLYDLYYEFNLKVELGWNDQMSWFSWHSWENQGVSPPGTLLGTWRRRKWFRRVRMDLPRTNHAWPAWLLSVIKWWICGWQESSGYHLYRL